MHFDTLNLFVELQIQEPKSDLIFQITRHLVIANDFEIIRDEHFQVVEFLKMDFKMTHNLGNRFYFPNCEKRLEICVILKKWCFFRNVKI